MKHNKHSLLLHCCCGPCTLYPLSVLRDNGIETIGFFNNPNIHPFREFERRVEAMEIVAQNYNLPMIWSEEGYNLNGWLENIGPQREYPKRCGICYEHRLKKTVEYAVKKGFNSFSTTLLYSRFQQHDTILNICRELSVTKGIHFYYHDFREGWYQGKEMAKKLGIYLQPYCGCIFSERERYSKREKRLQRRLSKTSEEVEHGTFTGDG